MSLKLEPGKYYKTRDGRKAFVGFCVPDLEPKTQVWVGYVCSSVRRWDVEGKVYSYGEHFSDLIEEWKEPEVYEFEATVDVSGPNYVTLVLCKCQHRISESLNAFGGKVKVRLETT